MSHTIPKDLNISEFLKLQSTMTSEQLGKHYGRTSRTINYWIKILRERGEIGGIPLVRKKLQTQSHSSPPTPPQFPEPLGKTYDDFITLKSDRTIILGDAEIPNHDPEIFELAYALAQKFNITDLILNGDFMSLDCFSTWARTAVYKLAFDDELESAEESLRTFLNHFQRIVWSTGNHERRLAYRVEGQFTIGKFLEKFSKGLTISEYAYCILENGTRPSPTDPSKTEPNRTMVVHPKNYSRIPLSTARELAAIYHMNIIAGHNHHQAQGYDRSGKYYIIDGGCCRDPKLTRYKSVEVTTHPAWNGGFTLVLQGQPYLINKKNGEFWKNLRVD